MDGLPGLRLPDWFQTLGRGAWLLVGIAVLLAVRRARGDPGGAGHGRDPADHRSEDLAGARIHASDESVDPSEIDG